VSLHFYPQLGIEGFLLKYIYHLLEMQHNLSQLLHEQTKDLIWMINPEFLLVYANPAYLKLMKEVTGKEKKLHETVFVEGFGAGYITRWKNYYKRAMLGEHFEIEEHFYHPETHAIEYSAVSFQPIYGDTEEIVAVACQSKDITRLVKQRSEAKQLLDSSLDVFCTFDEQGTFIYVNEAAKAHWGYKPDELLGTPYRSLVIEEDLDVTDSVDTTIRNGKEIKSFSNRFRKKDGGIAYNIWSSRWDERAKLFYSVARDGKEKLEQEEKLLQSEQRFKALVQEGSDLIGILDSEGNYIYVSPTSTSILGMPPEKFIGKSPFDFIHPDDIEATQASLQEIATENKVIVEPFRFQNSQKEWRWVETVLTNMLDNPAVHGIVANSRDITEKIEEEQKLKLFEKVINSTTDAILITEAEPLAKPGPKIIYVNEAFCSSTGYTAAEVLGKNPRFLQGPKSDKKKLKILGEKLRQGESAEITVVNYTKQGEEFWVNFAVSPVINENGKVSHFISVQRDVTEEKEKEIEQDFENKIIKTFHESNDYSIAECLKTVCEHIATYGDFNFAEIWLPTIDGKRINLVSNYTRGSEGSIFYKTSENIEYFAFGEALPGHVWKHKTTEVWSNEDKEWSSFKRKAAANKAGIKLVMGVPIKHGGDVIGVLLLGTIKEKSVLSSYFPLFQKLESIIGAELSRKKTEIELAQIFNFTPDMICVAGFDGHLKKVNPAGLELLGYSLEEMRSRPILSFIHEDDRLKTREKQKEVYKGGKIQAFENRYITKQGQVLWLSWSATAAPEQNIIYSVAKNITEEKNLRELNRQAGKLSKIGSWEVDFLTQSVYWSNMVHKIHETDPKTFVPNLESGINFYKKEFQEDVRGYIQESATTGEPFDFEAIIVTANNNERWVRVIGTPDFNEGSCSRISGSFQDIHERKEIVIALRQSEAKFRTIFEIATLGIAQVDPADGRVILVNSYYEKITGYSVEEMLHMNFLELTHPDDRKKDWELFSKAARGEQEYKNEKRYIKKDGHIVWVKIHLAFIRDRTGTPIRTVAICEDITERKEAELRLQSLADNLPGVVFQYYIYPDGTDHLRSVTKGSQEVWGFSAEEVTQNNQLVWKQIRAGGDIDVVQKSISDSVATNSKWSAQWRYVMPNGEIKTHLGYGSPNYIANGTVIFNSVILDVTEEAKNEKLLEQVSTLAKIGSWEVNFLEDNVRLTSMSYTILETDPKSYTPNFENSIAIYREDFQDMVRSNLEDCMKNGGFVDYEAVITTFENNEKWVRVVANAEMHKGECIRIFGSIQDITSQKEAEHEKNYLQTTLENSLNEIYIFDSKTFRFNYVNKGALRNLGYTEQEIKALTPLDLKPEYVSTSFKQLIAPLVNNEKEKIIFFTNHKRKDGTLYPVEVHLQLVKSAHNKRFLAIIMDITERKKAEQVILQANERFEKVTEATNDAIWDWDIINGTFYRSEAIKDFFGKQTSKLLSKRDFWKDAFHPDDLAETKESLDKALSDSSCKRWEAEYRVFDETGEVHYVLDRGVIIRNKQGKAIRMIGAMTNISDQKDYEIQLKVLNQELEKHAIELERSNEELEQFAFVTSHDLQEPLRMISSFMDQLKRKYEDQLDEKALQYIYYATDGAKRMKQIILDLLEYSRASKPSEAIEEVDLNEVIASYKQLRRKVIAESSATITAEQLPSIESYSAVVTQIFHGLLDNAIKYAREGVAPSIEITAKEKQKEWEFSIADNGIGIDSQFFDKIFIIFQRLHNRNTYDGTGIGLAIVKRSVEFLNGRIWLSSTVGKGTTFFFTIAKNKINNL
jgi:PAS domain S-box-containing protein